MTLVSVIVPCYNVAEFIESAVDRLLAQTHQDLEIVLVDDGSRDGTREVLARLGPTDPRIVVLEQANAGVAAARETAVRAARGDYVWFVDADDDWLDDAIAVLLAAALPTGVDLVCAGAEYRFPDGRVKPVGTPLTGLLTPEAAFRRLLLGQVTGHLWNKLVRRSLLERIEFTRSRHHSDQAMVAQLVARARTITAIDAVVYRYVLRAGSIIRGGTPRSASLRTVTQVVAACAGELGLRSSREYRYYRARFELLTGLKDATSGAYPPPEARALLTAHRRAIRPGMLAALLAAGDRRRFALLAAGWLAPPLYRAAMRMQGARD